VWYKRQARGKNFVNLKQILTERLGKDSRQFEIWKNLHSLRSVGHVSFSHTHFVGTVGLKAVFVQTTCAQNKENVPELWVNRAGGWKDTSGSGPYKRIGLQEIIRVSDAIQGITLSTIVPMHELPACHIQHKHTKLKVPTNVPAIIVQSSSPTHSPLHVVSAPHVAIVPKVVSPQERQQLLDAALANQQMISRVFNGYGI
jgi:hypothetical protein